MLVPSIPEAPAANVLVNRGNHIAFLQRAQEDCNKFSERFRIYCSHTQKICRELMKLRSWDTYQEERLLINREAELLHMYCQLSDEAVRIRNHIEDLLDEEFEGCTGDFNPSCRCWMGTNAESSSKGKSAEFGVLDFSVPDGSISFLDNKEDILEIGKRAERAVYIVLRGPENYPYVTGNLNFAVNSMLWPYPEYRTAGQDYSYFSENS
ncbi:hypothetical protein TWF281_008708 [Arthrobotrys megalospora]